MAKRYDEPIDVTPDPFEDGPIAFRWRGRLYEVDQRLASWREADARLWLDGARKGSGNGSGGSPDREFFRVLAHPSGVLATGDLDADGFMSSTSAVYDVYIDPARRHWCLSRVWD